MAPFDRTTLLITSLGTAVLALGVGTVIDEKTARDRCRDAPRVASDAVQGWLEKPIPVQLRDVPGFAGVTVADRNPHLVDVRVVSAPVRGFSYLAGYVELDGGNVRGPAVWQIFDPASVDVDVPAGSPSFDTAVSVSAQNHEALALTPLTGYGVGDPPPDARKALACSEAAR